MSTLSGVTQKGEKGKSRFQSLDINNLYNQTSRGESSEPHQQKSTKPRNHGMQPLGKVPSARRPPANLPSLKSEHSGNDPSVSLVPSGGTGWGSKPGETGPSPASQPTSQATTPTPVSTVTQTHGSSAPAAAGIGMPAAPTNIAPPQTPVAQPPPMMKPIIGNTSSGDKTWSSVTCGDSGPSFLAHQSPQFQQEFPSLSGEGAGQAPPGGVAGGGGGKGPGGGADIQYGPGPSLRPQTEGSWIGGGGARAGGSSGPPVISPPSHPPQHPYLPQEIVGGSQSGGAPRSNLGPFGAGGVPVGLPPPGGPPPPSSSAPPVPTQFRNVMPNFLQKASGFSGFPPPTSTSSSNFQNNIRPPRFNPPDMNRFNPSRHADPEDLVPRPIIKEEDLTRMDEIARDNGWAANNYIDYNQKIAFSDDESTGVDDDKEAIKEKNKDSDRKEQNRMEMDTERDSKEKDKPIDRMGPNDKQIWAGRGPGAGPVDFRQYSRPPHSMVSEHEDDHWSEKRRQTSENIKQVTEKAKQRKEEEEKKFEESRSKTSIDNDKSKGKKDDGSDMLHHNTSPMSEWNKDDMSKGGMMSHPPPPSKDSMNESGGNNFRQMTQIEGRNDIMRDRERFRNDRMEGGRNFHQAPRFQKQQMGQQQVRQAPSNAYDGGGGRWSNQNSHGGGPMNFPVKGSVSGRRGGGQPDAGDLQDNDRFLHKDDKMGRSHNDERDRYRPNARNDGAHESNRKNNYYDGPPDYNRSHHRDFDHNNRERTPDYRQRDRDELEWEGRRGNNASWDKQYDDKSQGRKDHKKPNEPFHKSQTPFGDDRDLDRPQRPESRDRPDRPPRPDSRDSRASRDSRNSRDSIREDSKSIPESSDFSWGLGDFDKESKDDKSRKKDVSKDEKRDGPRREGHVPGPITKEKMVAYEIKQQLSKTEKKEIISSTLINSVPEEDTRNKLAPFAPQLPASASDNWSENQDILGPTPGSLIKDDSPTMTPFVPASEDITDKSPKEDQTFDKKKDGGSIKEKDGKNSRGGRGPRTGNRQGERPYNPNSSNFFFQRNASGPTPYPRDNNRRRGQGKGGMKDKREFGSDSDGSLDEISASTESGKEDKKSERRQLPRSSRSGERKKDKDERNNRETKKIDNDKGLSSRKHGYDSVRKEGGFAPRGEPSRRGRGGYRTGGRGSLGNVGGHYGPPGSKSPFPSSSGQLLDNKSQEEDDKLNEKPLDMDHLLSSDADKSKHKSQHQGNITGGNRLPKDSRKSDVVIKGKVMRSKGGSGEERDSTSDAGSDSDTKKPPRNMQKTDKNKSNQRAAGDKRAPYNTAHMNGRPSRSDDGKDNGFQEVKGKKMGKESRPLSRGRKDSKGKNGAGAPGVGGGLLPKNNNSSSKSFQRESWTNNKPPRLQKLDNARKQQQLAQQQDVSEMNKINQSVVPLFSSTIRDVTCNMTPAPPPTKSAWEKPITAALRAPSPTNTLHLTSSISSNASEKPGMEIPDHVQSGTSSQTSSPSAEKVMGAKLGREVVDKGMLDGANPPVQTIIFENTNYKTPELAMKSKYSMKPNQRIDKGRGKLDEELEGATHGIGSLSFKTGVDLKSCDNKTQESLQMQITFKNEDNADMKLDFQFDSDFTTPQLTDDKTNIPRSIHLGQSSAELNQKIASVKKVWDTAGSAMEHQHHVDESHIVSTSSSSFLGGGVDSSLDHPSAHQVDDNTFTNADVYSPGMQGAGAGYAVSAAAMMKPDPTNPVSGQAAVMSTAIGAHSGQSLSSPPPPFNQAGPFGYQAQYSGMPTIPSPPAVLVNTQGAQVAANTQDFVPGHPYAFNSPMMSSQTQRSSFSQQHTFSPYRLSQNLSQGGTFGQPPASVYIQPQQTGSAPPELFPSVGPYLPPSYGQSQINSNPSTVLIASSSSSSLMSASVKSSPQQPHGTPALGAIGTKASFQNSQIQMGFMSYDHSTMIPSYMPASQLVTPRHGGGNVTTAMPPSSSFYSGSTAPTGFSSLLGSNSQTMHSAAANAFGMQTFNTQSAANQGAAPPSSNLGHPSFSTMGHFRAAQPPYMKPGGPGQHQPDASKSPSNNQDCLSNSVFGSASGGGGQIPSPKSRSSGGSSSSGKQVSPQQPSPTPTHHKFPTYSQQNMVGQPPPNSQAGPQRAGSQLGSAVRSNNGNNGAGTVNNSVHVKYPSGPPGPIQRPGPNSYQQHQQQVMQSYAAQQQQQQHPQQQQQVRRHGQPPPLGRLPQHKTNTYYMPQGNPVKMESGMEVKGDQDKFMDNGSASAKPDKKEEVSNSAEQ